MLLWQVFETTDVGEVVTGLEDGTRLSITLSLPVFRHINTHVHRHEHTHVIPHCDAGHRVDAESRKNNRIMYVADDKTYCVDARGRSGFRVYARNDVGVFVDGLVAEGMVVPVDVGVAGF